MFSGYWRLRSEPGRRRGLDRSHDSADEGMESSIFSGKTFSSSSKVGYRGAGSFASVVFLRRKGLLPGRFPSLGIVSCDLPYDKEAKTDRWLCFALRLLLGGLAAYQARRG